MRLQICCEDSLGFSQKLLVLLAERKLDLPAITRDAAHNLLLDFDHPDQRQITGLVRDIAQISGVHQVTTKPITSDASAFKQIISAGGKMSRVLEQAHKLAMLNAPLLIVGDTGTGKDLLAYACHKASLRGDQTYLAINCAAVPEDVVESELFGHAPGAYPNALEGKKGFFEQAHGGSVFLDEIGEMAPRMQVKLLRFLNDGTFRRVGEDHEVHVDVRMICATQKNLESLVQQGIFREDLYYRLKVLTLELPALCDRPQDILPLAEHVIADFAAEQGIACPRISAELKRILTRYRWPGNVRQLKNVLYQAMAQLEGNVLRPQDVALPEFEAISLVDGSALAGSLDDIIRRFERSVLTQLYHDYPSTRKLAQRLNVSHTSIANKLREYSLGRNKTSDG